MLGQLGFPTTTENYNEPRSRWAEAGLMCLGLDGKEYWRTDADPNFVRGSLLVAHGLLVIQDGHDGWCADFIVLV